MLWIEHDTIFRMTFLREQMHCTTHTHTGHHREDIGNKVIFVEPLIYPSASEEYHALCE